MNPETVLQPPPTLVPSAQAISLPLSLSLCLQVAPLWSRARPPGCGVQAPRGALKRRIPMSPVPLGPVDAVGPGLFQAVRRLKEPVLLEASSLLAKTRNSMGEEGVGGRLQRARPRGAQAAGPRPPALHTRPSFTATGLSPTKRPDSAECPGRRAEGQVSPRIGRSRRLRPGEPPNRTLQEAAAWQGRGCQRTEECSLLLTSA